MPGSLNALNVFVYKKIHKLTKKNITVFLCSENDFKDEKYFVCLFVINIVDLFILH